VYGSECGGGSEVSTWFFVALKVDLGDLVRVVLVCETMKDVVNKSNAFQSTVSRGSEELHRPSMVAQVLLVEVAPRACGLDILWVLLGRSKTATAAIRTGLLAFGYKIWLCYYTVR